MKPTTRIKDPYHNPFHNRFHVPVHSRMDEMQAFTQMIWLNERVERRSGEAPRSRDWTGAIASIFALLLIVVFSATWFAS